MRMPTTCTYRIPTYPGWWRARLWRLSRGRLAFPVWQEWEFDGVELKSTAAPLDGGSVEMAFSFKSVRRVS